MGLDEEENCIVCSALRENCHLCIKGHQLFYLFRERMESQQGNDKNPASVMRGCVRKIRIVALIRIDEPYHNLISALVSKNGAGRKIQATK